MNKIKVSYAWLRWKQSGITLSEISDVTDIGQNKLSLYLHRTDPVVPKTIDRLLLLANMLTITVDQFYDSIEISKDDYLRLSQKRRKKSHLEI